jgi:Transposase IS4
MLAEVVGSTLCMLWQGINAVLIVTTAYSPNDTIETLPKRPSLTSTNAHIVRPLFGDSQSKRLHIPHAIDAYNHHLGGVDQSNQLRVNLTVHRAFESRIWRPLHYYMMDTCLVNGWLIWSKSMLEAPEVKREMIALRTHFKAKRDYVLVRLKEIGLRATNQAVPDSMFYIWLDLTSLEPPLPEYSPLNISDGLSFFDALLKETVIVVPGIFFDLS